MNVHSVFDMVKRNRKKELIIDAAIQVFAEKGFYLAKVADVARRAGVADGTIYLYFKNKDDILISLFEIKMEEILNRWVAEGWRYDGMQFVVKESARRPSMAFVLFVKKEGEDD